VSALIPWVAVALAASPPAQTHDVGHRVAHLGAALEAVRQAPPALSSQASEYASAMERGACASGVLRLKVECLMTASRRFCKGREASCPFLMDVVVSNVLAESHFVPAEQKYEIMKTHRDYRAEVAREIRRIQGGLAMDFRLRTMDSPSGQSLPARIDSYCVSAADKTHLSWQACASSLVWFIGTADAAQAGHT
jgi:hypothetical protein